jgi:CheY-like chemotaxis protein
VNSQHYSLLNGLRVLVVDDNDDACTLITLMLELYNAEVTSVYSVKDALVQFEKLQPDLVISDIAMPDEDGYSLIRKLKAQSHNRRFSVIAMTAYRLEESGREILAAGFQRCLVKPVDTEQLIAAITELLSSTQASDTAPGKFC